MDLRDEHLKTPWNEDRSKQDSTAKWRMGLALVSVGSFAFFFFGTIGLLGFLILVVIGALVLARMNRYYAYAQPSDDVMAKAKREVQKRGK